jgi:hypothetical protein
MFFGVNSLCSDYYIKNPFKKRWVRFAETYMGPELRTAASRAVALAKADPKMRRAVLSRHFVSPKLESAGELEVERSFVSPTIHIHSRRVQQNYRLAIHD